MEEEDSDESSILSHLSSISTHIKKEVAKRPELVVNSKSIHSDFKIIKEDPYANQQPGSDEEDEGEEEESSQAVSSRVKNPKKAR